MSTWFSKPNFKGDQKKGRIQPEHFCVCAPENCPFQGGTLLNRTNFESLFPFVYFDLTKQKLDIKDGVTKLAFHYELSANANADYNIYALILHERQAEIEQQGGKLLLRA